MTPYPGTYRLEYKRNAQFILQFTCRIITSKQSSNHIRQHYITLYYLYIINQTLMMDTSVIYMNQLPVSERRGELCGTSLHGSTVGNKPDPCCSVSLGLCSSNLGM